MRYSEIANISEATSSENFPMPMDRSKSRRKRAADRLQQMNRDRIEMIAQAVDRELRRYLVSGEFERHKIARIIEPPRFSRRPVGLSQAGLTCCSRLR